MKLLLPALLSIFTVAVPANADMIDRASDKYAESVCYALSTGLTLDEAIDYGYLKNKFLIDEFVLKTLTTTTLRQPFNRSVAIKIGQTCPDLLKPNKKI